MDTQANQANTDPKFKTLCEKVVELKEQWHIPGVAVGVLHNGQEQAAGFGVTNVDHPLTVDAATLFQIGSITKTLTGTVIMRLVEAGKLDLDTPVRTYLPELRLADETVAAQVTPRHLLTHLGGWVGDYFEDTGAGDNALARYVARLVELEQLTPLGSIWSYNNAGFYLAGRLIEAVTGQSYEAATKQLVLDPLGMTHSFFIPADVMTYRFAVGHYVTPNGPQVARPWALARAAHPAGGLVTTIPELFKYARLHISGGKTADGTQLLASETVTQMQAPQAEVDLRGGHMGLTWFLRDVGGTPIMYHGGGTNGQITLLTLAPARQFAVAVLTNANLGGMLANEITKLALTHYLGVSEPEETPQTRDEASLQPYTGRYSTAMNEVEVTASEGRLILQLIPKGGFPTKDTPPPPAPPPIRAAFVGEDRILALDPPFKDAQADFLRDADGRIAWIRIGARIARKGQTA